MKKYVREMVLVPKETLNNFGGRGENDFYQEFFRRITLLKNNKDKAQ